MEYTITELPHEGENGEKLFETPTGRSYRVRVQGASYGPNIIVLDDKDQILTSSGIAYTGAPGEEPKTIVERQITNLVRNAEQQEVAREQAEEYFLQEWGVDIKGADTTAQEPVNGKVQYLNKE